MLAFVDGVVAQVSPEGKAVLRVGAFGVSVEMLTREASSLEEGEEVRLFTHLHIPSQEIKPSLYGFLEPEEREIFATLLKCPGVGPRVALALLEMGAGRLVSAIEQEELSALTAVPGVGAKTAQRIALELKGKFLKIRERLPESALEVSVRAELILALRNLGFRENEINSALSELRKSGKLVESEELDELLRLTLEHLRK